eukprot:2712483-Amphidinium_carterae.2
MGTPCQECARQAGDRLCVESACVMPGHVESQTPSHKWSSQTARRLASVPSICLRAEVRQWLSRLPH